VGISAITRRNTEILDFRKNELSQSDNLVFCSKWQLPYNGCVLFRRVCPKPQLSASELRNLRIQVNGIAVKGLFS